MSKPAIGTILDPDFNPTRDAIHVPIIPVYADNWLFYPGDKVNIAKRNDGKYYPILTRPGEEFQGIVDPFLLNPAKNGELFYCFLKPESVKKLWHEWTHPEIDK